MLNAGTMDLEGIVFFSTQRYDKKGEDRRRKREEEYNKRPFWKKKFYHDNTENPYHKDYGKKKKPTRPNYR